MDKKQSHSETPDTGNARKASLWQGAEAVGSIRDIRGLCHQILHLSGKLLITVFGLAKFLLWNRIGQLALAAAIVFVSLPDALKLLVLAYIGRNALLIYNDLRNPEYWALAVCVAIVIGSIILRNAVKAMKKETLRIREEMARSDMTMAVQRVSGRALQTLDAVRAATPSANTVQDHHTRLIQLEIELHRLCQTLDSRSGVTRNSSVSLSQEIRSKLQQTHSVLLEILESSKVSERDIDAMTHAFRNFDSGLEQLENIRRYMAHAGMHDFLARKPSVEQTENPATPSRARLHDPRKGLRQRRLLTRLRWRAMRPRNPIRRAARPQ